MNTNLEILIADLEKALNLKIGQWLFFGGVIPPMTVTEEFRTKQVDAAKAALMAACK